MNFGRFGTMTPERIASGTISSVDGPAGGPWLHGDDGTRELVLAVYAAHIAAKGLAASVNQAEVTAWRRALLSAARDVQRAVDEAEWQWQ